MSRMKISGKLALGMAATLAVGSIASQALGQTTVTWIGPAAGNWNVGANWTGAVVPNGNFNVLIDNGAAQNSVVTLDNLAPGIANLAISAGDQLIVGNNIQLTLNGVAGVATLNNAGTLSLNAGASNANLNIPGGVTLSATGGGNIVLSSAAGAAQITGGGTFVNVNNTIRGSGNLATNGMAFNNQGIINADVNGASIFIDPVSATNGFVNSGTMTASNGGTLRINGQFGGGITNAGTISAQNGSAVSLENSIGITGGTFTTSGTGIVHTTAGNTIFVAGTSNTGNWTLDNNSDTNYSGDFFNSGSVTLAAVGSNVRMLFNSGTTNLSGGGAINLGTTGAGQAQIGGGNGRLVNVNNTIRGAGALGANNQRFTNTIGGVVSADVNGQALFVDPISETDGFVNQGLMRAVNGGLLQLTGAFGGGINNTGGTITASGAGSEVQLVNSIGITGGTFSTVGAGVVRTAGGQTVFVAGTSNTGNWTLDNNSDTHYSADFVNSGSVNMIAGGSNTRLLFDGGTVNLTGAGTINMSTTGAGQAQIGGGTGRLVNVNNTIRGAGNLGANNQRMNNGALGVISADLAGQAIFIDPINEADGFINQGLMRAVNGGLLQLTGAFGGGINNTGGTITASGAGSEVQFFNSNFVLRGTLSTVGGGVIRVVPGQSAFLQDNTLAGNMIVDNSADLVFNPGTFTNTGSVNLNAGTSNSRMGVQSNGTLTLTGGGSINMTNGAAGGSAVLGQIGAGTIVNLNNTIRGSGNVAANNNSFINAGTISADVGGGALFVDPVNIATLAFNNTGMMQASNGGALQLSGQFGGGIDNTGGRIIANTGSQVQMFSSIGITGGTFATSGTGSINVLAGHTAFIADAANTGAMVVTNNADLHLIGTILNTGSITLAPGTGTARIGSNNGSTTLSGTGTVIMAPSGSGGAAVFGFTGGTLTLGPSQTLRGTGNLASNNTAIVNNGTINADQNGQALFVDPVAATNGFVNNNLMTASGGGILQFTGGFGGGVTNNGTISAQNGSLVQLFNSAGIAGGTFTSSGTGAVEAAAGNTVFIANNVNTGTINVRDNATLNGSGTLLNNGTIAVNPGANPALFNSNSGTLVITGTGSVLMNAGTNSAVINATGGTTIDFGAGQTVRGRGSMAANNGAIINRGLISASGGDLFIDPVATANGFVNFGTMRAEPAASMSITGGFGGGVVSTGGLIQVQGGGTLNTFGGLNMSAGSVTLDGVWNHSGGNVTMTFVRGAGTMNVTNGAVAAVNANGTNSGTSRIANVTFDGAVGSPNSTLDLNDNDLILTSGNLANVGQQIAWARHGSAWDRPGLTSTAAKNSVPKNKGLGAISGTDFHIAQGPTATFDGFNVANTDVVIKYTYNGDSDLNGIVNFDDYSRTDNGFNTGRSGWFNGDFDYNGVVNFDDYSLIDAAFNTQSGSLRRAMEYLGGGDRSSNGMDSPALQVVMNHFQQFGEPYAAAFVNSVPEPASVVMLSGLAAFAAGYRPARRHRRRAQSRACGLSA